MKQLSARSLLIGIAGLFVITASSMYVALKVGALPWPTVFVTVLSMALLKRAKNSTVEEINVTHTIMSSGAMVAGGLAFTLPGLFILNPDASVGLFSLFSLTTCGAVLGTLFSAVYRKTLLEEQKLSYPIGRAAFETLSSAIHSTGQSLKLFISMGFSIIFTVLRDTFTVIPSVVSFSQVGLWLSPMALGIGAMIDSLSAYLWVGGAVIGIFIKDATIKQSLGIGIMLGTGLGVLIKALCGIIKSRTTGRKINISVLIKLLLACLISSIFLALTTPLTLFQAVLTVLGAGLTTLLSGIMTGTSGVNPMEVFGIIVMLAISSITRISNYSSMFIIAAVTAVSCGLCGDVMNDLKSGSLIGTDPKAQLFGEGVGGVIGAILAVISLLAMKKVFGSFGTAQLPAPQAAAVATMAGGFGNLKIIVLGVLIGLCLFLCKVPAATLGLGIYLANYISFAIGLGALIKTVLCKTKLTEENTVNVVSSGLLGGEGITGVVIAIISMIGLN